LPDTEALLLVTMEPPASLEEEFNDWYDLEHFPQRCGLPGFVTGRRFVCLDGWPRWLALYDLTSTAVLETPDYLAVSGPRSTPWSRRILPRMLGRERIVARQVGPGHRPITEAPIARLVLAKYPAVAPTAETSLFESVAAGFAALGGPAQTRAFRPLAGEADALWVVTALGRPVGGDEVRRAATPGDLFPESLNIYAPYRRG
jgi:hypothetical protein